MKTDATKAESAEWRVNLAMLARGMIPLALGEHVYCIEVREGLHWLRANFDTPEQTQRFAAFLRAQARRQGT